MSFDFGYQKFVLLRLSSLLWFFSLLKYLGSSVSFLDLLIVVSLRHADHLIKEKEQLICLCP